MDAALYEEILTLVADKGYDLTKIEKTLQPRGGEAAA